ncbi:MAG TPA: hypothetical protein DCO68_07265 [Methylophilaceae bacterium]|nr:hypothetical protein [Methylophilaceae bacterium]HAJ71864.1 hypothetical protein [Methylophilaceae bacterium]
MTKYCYKIRSRNGAVVDGLQIYGRTEEDARTKLYQMYHNCEVITSGALSLDRPANSSYEDVLDLIVSNG